jgi:pimeloyl-ACP methyl ester carboxylesterase
VAVLGGEGLRRARTGRSRCPASRRSYLRGHGATRFRWEETLRSGQQSVLAVDTIALMDALDIDEAILGGFDWGTRTADIVAALWPRPNRHPQLPLAAGTGGRRPGI